jgi:hypothetical protein
MSLLDQLFQDMFTDFKTTIKIDDVAVFLGESSSTTRRNITKRGWQRSRSAGYITAPALENWWLSRRYFRRGELYRVRFLDLSQAQAAQLMNCTEEKLRYMRGSNPHVARRPRHTRGVIRYSSLDLDKLKDEKQ